MRLEQENDDMAHELVESKLSLGKKLDEVCTLNLQNSHSEILTYLKTSNPFPLPLPVPQKKKKLITKILMMKILFQ